MPYGGLRRSYQLYWPAGAATSGPLPLVVLLHGVDATPPMESKRTDVPLLAQQGLAIVAVPAGYQKSWNTGPSCCTDQANNAAPATQDDTGFVRAVVARVQARFAVDTSRVVAVGYSAGGRLAWRIACGSPAPFTAFLTYGAVPAVGCPSSGAPATVVIADGSIDGDGPFSGDPSASPPQLSLAQLAQLWRTRDGCGPGSSQTALAVGVTETTWSCPGGRFVRTVVYAGRRHDWPGSQGGNGVSPVPAGARGVDLAAQLLAGLAAQPRG